MALPLQLILESLLRYTLMAKDKKKHSKKDDSSEDILDAAAMSIKKFRKVTKQISKLSTGQKLVGGLALAAAGLAYLATRETDGAPNETSATEADKSTETDTEPTPAHKSRKRTRSHSE